MEGGGGGGRGGRGARDHIDHLIIGIGAYLAWDPFNSARDNQQLSMTLKSGDTFLWVHRIRMLL